MIHRLIFQIEITRDNNYNIDIKNIKFTDEFITKSSKEYLKYLNKIMLNNNIGIKYKEEISKEKLKNIELDYNILSLTKMKNNNYSNEFIEDFILKSREHLYVDGIISCPYVEENTIKDILILIPKKEVITTN
ncbi:unknown [Coprobacillus sp. CAG:605]|nr:unknown [Coprobacillus sp. CAG:605]